VKSPRPVDDSDGVLVDDDEGAGGAEVTSVPDGVVNDAWVLGDVVEDDAPCVTGDRKKTLGKEVEDDVDEDAVDTKVVISVRLPGDPLGGVKTPSPLDGEEVLVNEDAVGAEDIGVLDGNAGGTGVEVVVDDEDDASGTDNVGEVALTQLRIISADKEITSPSC